MLKKYFGLLIISIISSFIFYCTFLFQVWQTAKHHVVSDVPFHAEFILKFSRGHSFPAYSLWYRLVYIFSGFSNNYISIANTSIILLAALVSAKYLISHKILNNNYSNKKNVTIMSVALIFVMPIFSYYSCANTATVCLSAAHVYLGNIAPNQWHNSTLILAMPFNLLLFYFSVKNIKQKSTLPFAIMGILSMISILCKPNYALAFLPILCTSIIIFNIKVRQYLDAIVKCSLVAIPSLLTLAYQWYSTYIRNDLFEPGAKIITAPFFVWANYSPHIPLSLLLSITFPLLVLLLFFKKIDFYLIMSWLTFSIALFIMATFSEYPNWGAWNFLWGAISANYILFLSSIGILLKQPIDWKSKLAYIVFGLHFLTGCLLLAGFFIGKKSLML